MAIVVAGCAACANVQSAAPGAKDAEPRTFDAPREIVYQDSLSTLMALGWQITGTTHEDGIIQARTPLSLWTYGDLVTVRVVAAGDSRSRVDITSSSPQQFIDWGKNRENVERFYGQLDSTIKSHK